MYKQQAKVSVANAWKPQGEGKLGKENIVKDLVEYDYGESSKKEAAESEIADCELALVEANENLEVPERDKIMGMIITERDAERIYVTKEMLQDANDISDPYSIFTSDELSNHFNVITYFGVDDTEEKKLWLHKALEESGRARKVSNSKSSSSNEDSKVSVGTTTMPKPWPFNQSHNQKVEKESNAWKENIPSLVADDALFPQERPPNDWDLIKTPPRPKPKKRGQFIKLKWFAGDKVAAWYKNEFYVGKVTLVTPGNLSVQLHLNDWDYEKDKEVKVIVTRSQDEIYRLRTFDLEGREETKHIRWQEGDICWAWYTNENEYYSAWFQKFDETNPNYCHVVFDGFEEEGLYMCACNFVIPNYMWNAEYIKYDLKNDKDLILDQAKTTVRKEAALLRRARNARKIRGENKEFYLQPLEEERPWGENGVVGMTAQPTTLKKKYEPAPPPSAAGPSSSTRHQHPLPVSVPKTFKFIQRKKPVEEEFEEADDSEQSDVEDDGFTSYDRDLTAYTREMGGRCGAEMGLQAQFTPVDDPGPLVVPPPYVPPQAYGSSPPEVYGSCPPYVPPHPYGSSPPLVYGSCPPYNSPQANESSPPEGYGLCPPYVPPQAYESSPPEEPPAADDTHVLGQLLGSMNITEPSPFSSLTVETTEYSPFGMTEVPSNVDRLVNDWKKC